ncbi:Pro-Pol polyprotein [Thelohanellus kitauei]|uniref:Pro-Pol polyprotein n=1 Tax=Thelohanellus kitauei TaxID=669202 RepID=A0A0C2NBA7_THEKT|nr:Pro-Pol polyprotein [Thelohanellus kitauei]
MNFYTHNEYTKNWRHAKNVIMCKKQYMIEVLLFRNRLKNIVCRFGVPASIHSDKGRQFESLFFPQLCQIMKIKKSHSTPYHPEGNGLAERIIRTLKMRMRMLIQDRKAEWDKILDLALMSIRTSTNESTKFSPFQMVYGRMPRPISLPIPFIENMHVDTRELQNRIKTIEGKAKTNIDKSLNKYKYYYDIESESQNFVPEMKYG